MDGVVLCDGHVTLFRYEIEIGLLSDQVYGLSIMIVAASCCHRLWSA
jgi:hypothetical protein